MDFPGEKPPTAADKFSGTIVPGTVGNWSAWTQLSAALSHAVRWINISAEVDGGGSSGVDFELGIGSAGNEVSIPGLIVGNNSTTSSSGSNCASYAFYIPEGTRLSIRAAATGSTAPANSRYRVWVSY